MPGPTWRDTGHKALCPVSAEEQHEDDLAQHVREGGELDVAEDDADLQLGC